MVDPYGKYPLSELGRLWRGGRSAIDDVTSCEIVRGLISRVKDHRGIAAAVASLYDRINLEPP